jgi:hypothetical protein
VIPSTKADGIANLKKEFRSSGVQEFRSSGVQEFRSSGVQEFRSSGVQAGMEHKVCKKKAPSATEYASSPALSIWGS